MKRPTSSLVEVSFFFMNTISKMIQDCAFFWCSDDNEKGHFPD